MINYALVLLDLLNRVAKRCLNARLILISSTRLINLIIPENSCKIPYFKHLIPVNIILNKNNNGNFTKI